MKAYRFNGEVWYVDDRPIWARIRRWIVNVGLREMKNGRLSKDGPVLPMSFFGHRAAFFGHWFQVRTPWGLLVVVFKRDDAGKVTRSIDRAYISVTGTPNHAHTWFVGVPTEIVRQVDVRAVA